MKIARMIQLKSKRLKIFLFREILLRILPSRKKKDVPTNVKKIAIWQFGGIGDMIIGAAAVRDALEAYPDTTIDVYCSQVKSSRFIGKLGDRVTGIYTYDPYSVDCKSIFNDKTRVHISDVIRQHQERKYDLLINLHIPKLLDWWIFEMILMRRSGARFLTGFVPRGVSKKMLDSQMNVDVFSSEHYLDLYKKLLLPIGITVGDRGYFPITDYHNANQLVILHLGASVTFKRWPLNYFKEIAKKFLARGWDVAVIGDDKETKLGETMQQALPEIQNHVGLLNLQNMANLLASADLFIGNDSAPFHLAVAVNVKAVGLFGAGPLMYSNYPVENVKVVRLKLFCAPCFSNVCSENMECMTNISVQRVWTVCGDLVDNLVDAT